MDKHEAYGTCPYDDHCVAEVSVGLFEPSDNAGQRFRKSGVLEWDVCRNNERILLNDAGRDSDVLCVGTVVEEDVFAEILLILLAEVAGVTGSGVERDDSISKLKAGHTFANTVNCSGDLMSKGNRGRKHFGMIATAINLEVGATGEGSPHTENHFTLLGGGNGRGFNAKIFLTVEDHRLHGGWRTGHTPYFLTLPTREEPGAQQKKCTIT
jgi:hypothetical protein